MTTQPANYSTLKAISDEVLRARTKFPGNKHLYAALGEEFGELGAELLQDNRENQIKEAIQVAAVAIRIIEEGDSAFDVKDWDTSG